MLLDLRIWPFASPEQPIPCVCTVQPLRAVWIRKGLCTEGTLQGCFGEGLCGNIMSIMA